MALYQASEGITLVPTSYNYDQGRDGRTIDINSPNVAGILCATLSTKLDEKVRADITRLLKTTKTKSIIYCTARKLTEHACDEIERVIRAEYPQLEIVRVLSQVQIAALAEDHEEVLLANYPGEVRNLQQTLTMGDADSAALHGLRLALATSVGETAEDLRASLLERLILETLAEYGPSSVNSLSAKLASQLHLPRAPSAVYVHQALEQLHTTHSVYSDLERWAITEQGRAKLEVSEAPARRLLEGRTLIRGAIGELTGKPITDQMFEQFWNSFQATMADAFHEHGLNLIQSIRGIVEDDDSESRSTFRQLLEGVAQRASAGFTNPEQRDEISQAVIDIFAERGSPAFDWLTEICSVYVMLCSLGLEARSARQISEALRSLSMVPDSDIVLSLLCEGEKNHPEVERIIRGWQALGGSVQAAVPVLSEMAHHAWIAPKDYLATRHQFQKLNDISAERVIINAFTRSFWRMSKGHAMDKHWQSYINDYRGASETDYSRVARILREEYGINILPDYIESSINPPPGSLEDKLFRFIRNRLAEDFGSSADELDYRTIDKARRDAQLLANMCEARRSVTAQRGQTPVIVSSARVLRQASTTFKEDFGEPEAVVTLPAVATLLAVTPGVHLGLGALRTVLFDIGLSRMLMPLQRLAYRVIAASDLYSFPYSRRGTLRRRLREQVLRDAGKRAKPAAQVERELLNADDEEFARTVVTALDKMAVEPRVGEVMRQQQAEIEALQAEVRRLRETQQADGPSTTSA